MKTQSHYLVTAVIAVAVGTAAFFGGMQYQLKQRPVMNAEFGNRMAAGPRGQGGVGATQGASRFMGGMAPVSGEILSQDETSITVKMPDGTSKIVILSNETSIQKSSDAEKSDLKIGEKVTAFGTQNQDGSVTAQSVSLGAVMMQRGTAGQMPSSTPMVE